MNAEKGLFDDDPAFELLRRLREEDGYDGPLDQDLNAVDPTDVRAQAADALRSRGGGT